MRATLVAIGLLALLVGTSGCRGFGVRNAQYTPTTSGKLFLAPTRDMTHGGQLVSGSGAEFEMHLRNWLSQFAPALQVVTSTGGGLSHTQMADRGAVLRQAAAAGADRALVVTLGDMRDAAPMTFRSDYITLQTGSLLRVNDGLDLWNVAGYVIQGTNLGNWHTQMNALARLVAATITR